MQKVIPKLQGRVSQSREKGINIMEKIKGLWLGFAEKHPGASKWIREGGLFVIVSNLITVLKYFMLLFLPLAFAGLPKVISDSRESILLYSERLSNGTSSVMTLHTADFHISVHI